VTALADNYRWEAETEDGRIITTGGDLGGCARIAFVPRRPGLARHDLSGVDLRRRFGRGFIRVMGTRPEEYVHCVVCRGFRFWLSCSNGSALITPEDFELYL